MKIDHAIAAGRHPSAIGGLDPPDDEHLCTEEAEQNLSANLKIALQNLEGVHRHLCPRQVLGVRIGLFAGRLLNIELPQEGKEIFAFMETDGCAVDGVSVATGCSVGRRTMRIMDFGKVAATFVDTRNGEAVRIVPQTGIRAAARNYAPAAQNRWTAQLKGYQVMPSNELLRGEPVQLTIDLERLINRAGVRVNCEVCGEEIINEREVVREGMVLCRPCAGEAYFERLAINDQLLVRSFA